MRLHPLHAHYHHTTKSRDTHVPFPPPKRYAHSNSPQKKTHHHRSIDLPPTPSSKSNPLLNQKPTDHQFLLFITSPQSPTRQLIRNLITLLHNVTVKLLTTIPSSAPILSPLRTSQNYFVPRLKSIELPKNFVI